MKRHLNFISLCAAAFYCFLCVPAFSHEFVIKPAQTDSGSGDVLPFSVLSCHVFMKSEEIEPIDNVEVSLVKGKKIQKITLQENTDRLTLDGTVKLTGKGSAILAGHRKGMVWTQTTNGWKQAGKTECSGVISSGKYEKFCKALVIADGDDDEYGNVIGHTLEIVPVTSPSKAEIGDDMEFKILYEGKPLSTEVYATWDGFSENVNTYSYFTETDENGVAKVKITHPGTWMVRVQKTNEQTTENYDTHVMRATFVFGVN